MKNKALKISAYTISAIIGILYLLFLTVPFIVNGIIKSHTDDIVKIIEESTGFKSNLEGIKLVTTPKLTAGLEVEHTTFKLPDNSNFLSADNFQIKLSLVPIFIRKIELDKISIDNPKITLGVKKDGRLLIEDTIEAISQKTKTQNPENEKESISRCGLPFGIKLTPFIRH